MQDSIQNNGGGHGAWQTVDEIVVPSHAAEPLVPVGMKTVGAVKPASVWKPVHSASDSTARARRDSISRACAGGGWKSRLTERRRAVMGFCSHGGNILCCLS